MPALDDYRYGNENETGAPHALDVNDPFTPVAYSAL
jgi:hypothetical protein